MPTKQPIMTFVFVISGCPAESCGIFSVVGLGLFVFMLLSALGVLLSWTEGGCRWIRPVLTIVLASVVVWTPAVGSVTSNVVTANINMDDKIDMDLIMDL